MTAYEKKLKRAALYDAGLCYDSCGRPRDGKMTRCRVCLDKVAKINLAWKKRTEYNSNDAKIKAKAKHDPAPRSPH